MHTRLIKIGEAAKILGSSPAQLRKKENSRVLKKNELAQDVLEIITVFSARL
jgi:predicted site-specific integrase-resolvase